jgi:hypothetical protein
LDGKNGGETSSVDSEVQYEEYSAELKMNENFYLNLYEKLKRFNTCPEKENASKATVITNYPP